MRVVKGANRGFLAGGIFTVWLWVDLHWCMRRLGLARIGGSRLSYEAVTAKYPGVKELVFLFTSFLMFEGFSTDGFCQVDRVCSGDEILGR